MQDAEVAKKGCIRLHGRRWCEFRKMGCLEDWKWELNPGPAKLSDVAPTYWRGCQTGFAGCRATFFSKSGFFLTFDETAHSNLRRELTVAMFLIVEWMRRHSLRLFCLPRVG